MSWLYIVIRDPQIKEEIATLFERGLASIIRICYLAIFKSDHWLYIAIWGPHIKGKITTGLESVI